jgi:hypothetical protein
MAKLGEKVLTNMVKRTLMNEAMPAGYLPGR